MKFFKSFFQNLCHPAGIAGVILAVLIPFLIYLAPNVGAKDLIRILDLNLPLPLFMVQLALGLFLLIVLSKDLRSYVKEHRPPLPFLILVTAFALVATIFAGTQIEARHRVQSDESVFMAIAQNMYHDHTSGTCDEGEFTAGNLDCYKNADSFKAKGLSFLYFLGMPIFGSELHWIFGAELVMLFFAALLLFFAIRAWTSDDLLSALSAIILIAQPTVLFQFRSMSVEPLYIFLSALALWTLRWAYDRNTVRHWILLALVLAFFAQTRQETAFCLLAFLAVALPKILDKKDFKAPAFFVSLSLFSVPILLTISYFQGYGFQGGENSAHGHFFENLSVNWEVMTRPLSQNGLLANPFLSSFNYLFLAGLVILVLFAGWELVSKRPGLNSRILGFLFLYHVQTYMILENVSGDFTIEINQRYALVMMPTMAFLAAFAVKNFLHAAFFLLGKLSLETNPRLNFAWVLLFGALAFGNTARYIDSFRANIMYNRNHLTTEEAEIWKWLSLEPQKQRLFVYGRPWHFVAYGVSSVHYNRVRNLSPDSLENLVKKYNGEVYYIRGLDCWDSRTYHRKAVEHRIATTCDIFEREHQTEEVYRVKITNNYWLEISRLKASRGYDPENLFTFGFWMGDMKSGELIFNSSAPFDKPGPWKIRFGLNGDSVYAKPYVTGTFSDTLGGTHPTPGYNLISADITDTLSNEKIAHVENYRFFRHEGALQMTLVQPTSHVQGWGEFRTNSTIDGRVFTLASKKFPEGFGTHAPSKTEFNLRGDFARFTGMVGVDEESLCGDGIAYKIFGDGRELYRKGPLTAGKIDTFDVSVRGVKNLSIETDALSNKDCDHVDIVLPTLYPDPDRKKEAVDDAVRYRPLI